MNTIAYEQHLKSHGFPVQSNTSVTKLVETISSVFDDRQGVSVESADEIFSLCSIVFEYCPDSLKPQIQPLSIHDAVTCAWGVYSVVDPVKSESLIGLLRECGVKPNLNDFKQKGRKFAAEYQRKESFSEVQSGDLPEIDSERKLADAYIQSIETEDGLPSLMFVDELPYLYQRGLWVKLDPGALLGIVSDGLSRIRGVVGYEESQGVVIPRVSKPNVSLRKTQSVISFCKSLLSVDRDKLSSTRVFFSGGDSPRTVEVIDGRLTCLENHPHNYCHVSIDVDYDKIIRLKQSDVEESECWRLLTENCDDLDDIEAITRAFGIALFDSPRLYQECLVLQGGGCNGKSAVINVFSSLFPSHIRTSFDLLDLNDESGHKLEPLVNSKIAISEDVKRGTLSQNVKTVIDGGGDVGISINPKGRTPYSAQINAMFVMGTNHPIRSTDDSYGFWRRFCTVKFNKTITDPDRELVPRIQKNERDVAVKILIDAVKRAQIDRINKNYPILSSEKHLQTRQSWKRDSSSVESFIEDCANTDGTENQADTVTKLYDAYSSYCKKSGIGTLGKPNFKSNLESIGFTEKKGKNGIIFVSESGPLSVNGPVFPY